MNSSSGPNFTRSQTSTETKNESSEWSVSRRNDPRCPVDNEPLVEAEQAVGGQPSEVHLSTEELQRFARPRSCEQTRQLSFPIPEQHPHLQPELCCGTSRRVGSEVAARPRHQDEDYHLPYQLSYQPEDGNQASGWSGCGALTRMSQGGGQRTSPHGLFLGYRQAEGGRDRFGLNVPTEDEGQDANQRYRRNGLENRVTPAKQKEIVTEYCCGAREVQLCNENRRRLRLFDEAILSEIEGRFCSGIYHWRIKNFQQCRQDAITGTMKAQFSPAINTSLYGYTFCMRIYLNGVNSGVDTHVALYVHMMQGDYDNRLTWPFTGVITLSILDQSGAEGPNDITQVMVASPKLCAFRKPTSPCSHVGCGFEMFAPIPQICSGPFIQNDTMLVRIEISR
ncbi:uncharacterized protein LOC144628613 isoform X3 [Oculina patagonica]